MFACIYRLFAHHRLIKDQQSTVPITSSMLAASYTLITAFILHPASLHSPTALSVPRACASLKFDEVQKSVDVEVQHAAKDVKELLVQDKAEVAESKWLMLAAAFAGGTGLAKQLVDEAKNIKLDKVETFIPARQRSSLPISKKKLSKITDEPIERVLPYWQLW